MQRWLQSHTTRSMKNTGNNRYQHSEKSTPRGYRKHL